MLDRLGVLVRYLLLRIILGMSQPDFYINKQDSFGRRMAEAVDDPQDVGAAIVAAVRTPPKSMLSEAALRAMYLCAREAKGDVVEIGAYVGGGTVVLMDACSRSGNQIVTIEEPVQHLAHPDIPTSNSIADLKANVEKLAPKGANHLLLSGYSFEAWVLGELHHRLLGRSIGFLAWDADSSFERDLALLTPFLEVGSLIMVDDYITDSAKSTRITVMVDRLTAAGVLEPIAYLPWATWFGRVQRLPSNAEVRAWMQEWEGLRQSGDPYADRLLGYREKLRGAEPVPALTFDERAAFWKEASEWRAPN